MASDQAAIVHVSVADCCGADEAIPKAKFKLTFFLEPDFIYMLVATTFVPNVTGSFFISASGPGSVTFSAYVVT